MFKFSGGDRREWGCGQVEHDPEVLQGHIHPRLQEDYWRGFPGAPDRVSYKEYNVSF